MGTHRFVVPDPFSSLRQGPDQGVSATAARTIDPASPRLRLLRAATAPAAAAGLDLTARDRRLLAQATRYDGLVRSQASRQQWPKSATIRPAWNRLGEASRAWRLVGRPMRR